MSNDISKTLRILCLGDSITSGKSYPADVPGGYRLALGVALTAHGHAVQFLGSQVEELANGTKLRHEGWPGYRIDQLGEALASQTATTDHADYILLLAGTNDVRQGHKLQTVHYRLENLVHLIAQLHPSAHLLIANAPPLRHDPTHPHQVEALAQFNAIFSVVTKRLERQYRLTPVDLHSYLTVNDISADTVHPTNAGYHKIARAWYRAITGP